MFHMLACNVSCVHLDSFTRSFVMFHIFTCIVSHVYICNVSCVHWLKFDILSCEVSHVPCIVSHVQLYCFYVFSIIISEVYILRGYTKFLLFKRLIRM